MSLGLAPLIVLARGTAGVARRGAAPDAAAAGHLPGLYLGIML